MPIPSDLDQFWSKNIEEVKRFKFEPTYTSAPDKSTAFMTAYQLSMRSFDEVRVGGFLFLPTGLSQKVPGVIYYPGYSGQSLFFHPDLCANGYVVLDFSPRAMAYGSQDFNPGRPGLLTYGILDKETYAYRKIYMDCLLAIELMRSHPNVDSDRLGVMGASQGGGLSIAISALSEEVKASAPEVPFLCNYEYAMDHITTSPYVELKNYLQAQPSPREKVRKTLSYFDCLSLAHKIRCPILLGLGLKDAVCPPETVHPVYKEIRSQKAIIEYPDVAHSRTLDFRRHQLNWMNIYLKG